MDYKKYIGVNAATNAAGKSEMPGLLNGPGDAYRHIVWAAEMTRRFGEAAARAMLGSAK